jgi:hypothetical protein
MVNQPTEQVYDDVHVLTIPGFVWFKDPHVAPAARYGHTCELVGGSQLISIGGLDNPQESINEYYDVGVPGPFTQGIGIFDMTSMVWKSSYDANATSYQSPQVIKIWYYSG